MDCKGYARRVAERSEKVCKWLFAAKRPGKQGEKQCSFFSRGIGYFAESTTTEGSFRDLEQTLVKS